MLEVLLLGKPLIRVAERALKLRDRKGVALIAYLAAEGATSRDKLADLLWSDKGQTEARRNLRQRLYELKNQLPENCLSTDGDLVALGVPCATDLERFQTGDDETALTAWRGPLLEDLELSGAETFQEWLDDRRERLHTRFTDLLRRTATSRETAGDLRGALELHQRALELDELQESHQREAMRLLGSLGEREAALRQFERFREALRRELGDAPLPQTQQLADSLRRASHQNTLPRDGSPLEPGTAAFELNAPLTGRDGAWRELEAAAAKLALVVGEPGVGKTRLAEELAHYLSQKANATWHALRGREGSSSSPLYPVAETLRAALQDSASWLNGLEPIWRSECARLVPEMQPDATPQPLPSIEGRVRFLEGLARALVASVGEGGALLLDDLHWFDSATLELTAHLARRAKEAGVRLIATARHEELVGNESAAPILNDLKRDGALLRFPLEPLLERDVRALIQTLSGGQDAPNFAYRLHAATSGNPFYLLETLRELHGGGQLQVMASGAWTTPFDSLTSSYSELPIPTTVRETVLHRVTRAGPATRRLLEAASLVGDGFSYGVIGSAVALGEWEGLEALERAVNARLIEPSSQVSGGYVFNHDLTRRALDDALNPDRRILLHRKLAVTLETSNGSSAQIAEHFERGEWKERAAKWRVKAGEEAARVYAYREAIDYYKLAIRDGLAWREEYKMRCLCIELLKILDNHNELISEIKTSLEISSEKEDFMAQAQFFASMIDFLIANNNLKDALSLVKKEETRQTRLLGTPEFFLSTGKVQKSLKKYDMAIVYYKKCIAIAEKDSKAIGYAYIGLSDCLIAKKETRKAVECTEKAVEIFSLNGDKHNEVRSLLLKAKIFEVIGNSNKSIIEMKKALEISQEYNLVRFIRGIIIDLANSYLENSLPVNAVQELSKIPIEDIEFLSTDFQAAYLENYAIAFRMQNMSGDSRRYAKMLIKLGTSKGNSEYVQIGSELANA